MAYLQPARHRLNFTIRPRVLVRRILFDGQRAVGVEVESGGEVFEANGREIVVSAGAIASPQLLMLSGLGPAARLRQMGISVVRDLAGVGENLRDHPLLIVLFRTRDGVLDDNVPVLQAGLRYTAEGSATRNDLYLIVISTASDRGSAFATMPGQALGSGIGVALENATTAGTVRLNSADPHVQPAIEYNYLADAWDQARLRQGVRLVVQLAQHPAYTALLRERLTPTDEDLVSDEALDAWMLTHVTTQHHSSGTCKMGPASDPMAVVNQYGQVHGIEGLRVVDASIMPDVIRANTNATVIMMGERVADWLRR
jgi:choline dehydrogenase